MATGQVIDLFAFLVQQLPQISNVGIYVGQASRHVPQCRKRFVNDTAYFPDLFIYFRKFFKMG